MIGLDTSGYAGKFADTASIQFLGINAESVDITVSRLILLATNGSR